ncbi:MAG: MOSC N-terminal beta barrel domain-containing protein [Ilumatobacteraceae bacterium]
MIVEELWRAPVKSMGGERLDSADVSALGIDGDRQWAVIDLATGYALTAKREPELLSASASVVDGEVLIHLDANVTLTATGTATDAVLSDWLGKPVSLRRAGPPATYEIAADFEAEHDSELFRWQGPEGTFHDSTRTRVSIAARAEMRDWAPPRFRMNVLVSGGSSAPLVGTTVRVGSVVLDVVKPVDRCILTTRAQPGGIERNLDVLRVINKEMDGILGVGTMVVTPGRIAVGDSVLPS